MTIPGTASGLPARRSAGALAVAILVGGGVAGLLDITYACINVGLRGVSPERLLQFVASGLLGSAAFDGGLATAALGLALHFAMALVMAAVFTLASLALPTLRLRPILWGLAYGAGIFFVMNFIVVPLSAVPQSGSPSLVLRAVELVSNMLLVGLPISFSARWKLGAR
jgi:hypothetical protein